MKIAEMFREAMRAEQDKDTMLRCLAVLVAKNGGTLTVTFKEIVELSGNLAIIVDSAKGEAGEVELKIVSDEEAVVLSALNNPNPSLN